VKCNFTLKTIFFFILCLFPIFHFCREGLCESSSLKSSLVKARNNYFPEEPTDGVQSTVQKNVTLQRQSQKKTDKYYNFYLQSDTITLAMNYDPSLENPMVTRQGGTLKGKVNINTAGTSDGYQNWVKGLSVTKPVSRPWVEWIKDELIDTETTEGEKVQEVTPLPLPPDYEGPTTLALNQPRDVTFTYYETGTDSSAYPSKLDLLFEGSDVSIETPHPINITGNGQQIKVKLRGVKLTDNPATPTKMKVTIRHKGEFKSNYLYEIPIWVFDAGMAVDYNRDGEIHFSYENVPDSSKDEIPLGKYYEFWLNDDHDMPNNDGVEDDVNDGLKDSQFSGIPYLRGLEDFTRLWVKKVEAIFARKEFSYGLRFEEIKSPSPPQIKLFYATDPDGGLGYLKDMQLGQNQLSTQEDSHFAGDVGSGPIKAISFIDVSKSNGHYIFEGVKEGKANLTLRVFYGGVNVAKYAVPLQIRPITDFYEEYTVGVYNDSPDIAPLTTPTPIRSSVSAAIDENNQDYFLFVHGWNWDLWTKRKSAETSFKRLWWQGYKGRFGLFRWPNAHFTDQWLCNNFNISELNAWKSGAGLLDLLKNLKVTKGYSVNVIAHSQGNVVVAEALREAKENNDDPTKQQIPAPLLNGYLASQAALSSSYYVTSPVRYFETNERNWSYTTPIDYPAHYPTGNEEDSPYMDGTQPFCSNWVNFYNPYDVGVGDDTNMANWLQDWLLWPMCGASPSHNVSAWEYNNKANRPWITHQSPTVDYPNYAYDAWQEKFVFFYDDDTGYHQQTLDPSNHDDRFKIFSFAAQSYGITLGGVSVPFFKKADGSDGNFDLSTSDINFGQSRADHNGEFMYGIQRVWPYWDEALSKLGIEHIRWSK
jgi:hypothetical protein